MRPTLEPALIFREAGRDMILAFTHAYLASQRPRVTRHRDRRMDHDFTGSVRVLRTLSLISSLAAVCTGAGLITSSQGVSLGNVLAA